MKFTLQKIIKYILILIVLSWLGYGIWYSIEQYNLTQENITVCGNNGCIRTMHIHSDIHLTICGQKINFPRETGPLSGLHTHKEKNYLHFHDKVPLVSGEPKIMFDKRLTLAELFEVFKLDPAQICGRPTENLSLNILVNDLPVPEGLLYMWSDGDDIVIEYS